MSLVNPILLDELRIELNKFGSWAQINMYGATYIGDDKGDLLTEYTLVTVPEHERKTIQQKPGTALVNCGFNEDDRVLGVKLFSILSRLLPSASRFMQLTDRDAALISGVKSSIVKIRDNEAYKRIFSEWKSANTKEREPNIIAYTEPLLKALEAVTSKLISADRSDVSS